MSVVEIIKTIPELEAERFERLDVNLKEAKIDLLVCRLPENILYLTGLWPNAGLCWVLYRSIDGKSVIVNPGDETKAFQHSWIDGIAEYTMGDLLSLTPINERVVESLSEAINYLGGGFKRIGWERGFDLAATCHWQGEFRLPTETESILRKILPEVEYIDAASIICASRRQKTPAQIQGIRIVNEIAVQGLNAAKEMIRPGIREIDVQISVESAIASFGTGYKNVGRVRAYAGVMSGPRSYMGDYSYNFTGDRIIQGGDQVLIELVVCAEGYWADLTRTFVAGQVTDKQREVYGLIKKAYYEAVKALKPGVRQTDVDKAARKVFEEAGYGDYHTYEIGHGCGLNYHEDYRLHPASNDLVRIGDTYTIEPGLYIPDFGGMRIEDNYLVTETGCENLTPFSIDII